MKVIETKNLGKKYIISHQGISEYQTLRETITDKAKKIVKKRSYVIPKREEFWALKNVSFNVEQGERIGIIGRNGAGKSTILKLLSRITEPSEGQIKIKGKIASLLEVGTGFHPELTGRENIFLNGAILGMSRIDIKKKFDEIVAFAEIEKFLDTPVKRYSSGMYVRLAFSIAAHLEPDILLIDEVLAVGDAQFQKKSLGKMEEVSQQQERTILFVSHNMQSINKLCKRCIWLENGSIKEDGLSETVTFNYLNLGQNKESEVNWLSEASAPGDKEYIYIKSIKIKNSNNTSTSVIFAEEDFFIEIEYVVLKTLNISQIGICLLTSEGELIFQSGDTDLSGLEIQERKPGNYISRCKIPGFLLNQGYYNISLFGHIPGIKMIINTDSILSFEIVQRYNLGGYGKQPGFLRPKLEWEIEKI
ncbi:MAG: ABC transporter ATP-binding protein [Actinobacteria bacterium]|nr:ABC transporter ATP-binding protein [Cyanobacteriota bacterium]MCL5771853.1 ABC transporter ATP-binding protein [Actinomycetota bacterium]